MALIAITLYGLILFAARAQSRKFLWAVLGAAIGAGSTMLLFYVFWYSSGRGMGGVGEVLLGLFSGIVTTVLCVLFVRNPAHSTKDDGTDHVS